MAETFDFDLLLADKTKYSEAKESLRQRILEKDIAARHSKAAVVFDGKSEEMTLGRVLLNMYFLQFYADNGIKPSNDRFFRGAHFTSDTTTDELNAILKDCERNGVSLESFRHYTYDLLNALADTSSQVNPKVGRELCLSDILDLEKDKTMAEVMNPTIEFGKSYDQVESLFKKNTNTITKFYQNHPESGLAPYVTAESGINPKQFTQMISFDGLKPDINDRTIPSPIMHNFIGGISSIEEFFVLSKGARKALITNYTMVRKSGYLTRKLTLLNCDTHLDCDVDDCGTKHFVRYKIDSKLKLEAIDGRSYYELLPSGLADYDNLKTIDCDSDSALVGKTIALRSPVTCALHDGHICKTCYGKALAEINKDLHVGILSTLSICEPMTQKLLSAKHILTTNNEKIEWNEAITDSFTVDMSMLYLENENATIIIPDITADNYNEEDGLYAVNHVRIRTVGAETKASTADCQTDVTLYINPKFNPKIIKEIVAKKKCTLEFTTEDFDDGEYAFIFEDRNKAISKGLRSTIDLIERSSHLDIDDIDTFANKFIDLSIENGFSIPSVHLEVITKNLILDKNGDPIDWSQPEIPPYDINRVSGAIMKGPVSKTLAFERLREQFSNISTYEKTGKSMMDEIFR